MLVSAFGATEKRAARVPPCHREGVPLYSYGDAMLIERAAA